MSSECACSGTLPLWNKFHQTLEDDAAGNCDPPSPAAAGPTTMLVKKSRRSRVCADPGAPAARPVRGGWRARGPAARSVRGGVERGKLPGRYGHEDYCQIRSAGLRGATPEGGWSTELAGRLRPHADRHSHRCGLDRAGQRLCQRRAGARRAAGIEPLYRGETVLEPERLSETLHQHTFWQGRGGSITHTISGVDIALWDLLGQATGQPVGRLLGGRYRSRVRPYASLLMQEPSALTIVLHGHQGAGVAAPSRCVGDLSAGRGSSTKPS